ncbi:hypothetical protein ACA910_015576 [Epithemia clementina (nom. ined.)]
MTKVLVHGFSKQLIKSPDNPQGILEWYCAPDSWSPNNDDDDNNNKNNNDNNKSKREGRDGKWELVERENEGNAAAASLIIYPAAKKDFWRRTYYEPLLIKDDGALLYATLKYRDNNCYYYYYTVETCFCLYASPSCQFDQAGLMIRLNAQHWIKTGIEVVDRKARLSCVVTNIYSDWSTQPWPSTRTTTATATTRTTNNNNSNHHKDGDTTSTTTTTTLAKQEFQKVDCTIRVHCRGTSFVVEAWTPHGKAEDGGNTGDTATTGDWEFIRIAHLSDTVVVTDADPAAAATAAEPAMDRNSTTTTTTTAHHHDDDNSKDSNYSNNAVLWAGVFACCPEDQRGGHVEFTSFTIQEGSNFDHNAQGNLEY